MTVPTERRERPMRTIFRLIGGSLSLSVVLASGPAAAGPLDAPGAAKALACSACHGLRGQPPGYLANQMLLFKADRRSPGDATLKALKELMKSIPDDQIADLAAYYSSLR